MNFAGEGGESDPPPPLDPHMKHMLERFCLFRISRWLSTREVAGRKAIECSSPLQLYHSYLRPTVYDQHPLTTTHDRSRSPPYGEPYRACQLKYL